MERNIRIDHLRIVLSFLIIAVHIELFWEFDTIGNLLRSFTRAAVPLFLMISGYYFYNSINNKKSIIKYVKRILFLYVVWMIIYFPFYDHLSTPFEKKQFALTLVIGYYHLWYLPALIGGILVLLALNKLNIAGKYTHVVFILILFSIGWGLQTAKIISSVPTGIKGFLSWTFPYRNFLFLGYPFLAIGFLIHKHEEKILRIFNKKNGTIALIISSVLLMSEMYLYNLSGLPFAGTDLFYSLLILCPVVFIFTVKYAVMSANSNVANFSSGIFFIHPFLIFTIGGICGGFKSWDIFIFFAFLSVITTAALVVVNKKLIRIL